MNFGPYPYVEPRLNMVLKKRGMNEVKYIGRKVSSVTGSSYSALNKKEFKKIYEKIFKWISLKKINFQQEIEF